MTDEQIRAEAEMFSYVNPDQTSAFRSGFTMAAKWALSQDSTIEPLRNPKLEERRKHISKEVSDKVKESFDKADYDSTIEKVKELREKFQKIANCLLGFDKNTEYEKGQIEALQTFDQELNAIIEAK